MWNASWQNSIAPSSVIDPGRENKLCRTAIRLIDFSRLTAQVMDLTLITSYDLLLGFGTIRTMKN
jgi:hypothetical protein